MALPIEAIELPPEANPLTPQLLLNTLSRASSTDQQQVQTATQQLQNWERQPGYYSSLQSVFCDKSLPVEVRYISITQLKHAVDKYWRKTAQNAISKEEKSLIKSRCIEAGIYEPDHRLIIQNAVVAAKIIRHEFPNDWPDALTSLTQSLRDDSDAGANTVFLPRVLTIILEVVKELSRARLQRSRVSLYKAAPEMLQVLGRIYLERLNHWLNFLKNGGDDEGGAIAAVDQSLLTLRVLRRLIIAGYDHPNRDSHVQEFWAILQSHFSEILSLVLLRGKSIELDIRVQVEKHLVQISKVHLDMVKTHPASFPQLPNAIGIAKSYWGLLIEFGKTFGTETAIASEEIGTDGDAEQEIPYLEKLSLKGLLILRACVKMVYNPTQTFKYQHAQDKEERQQSQDAILEGMLSEDLIREMMEILVVRFFVFRSRDLREWEAEPDEWEKREEGESDGWEFSIRICAEKLFLDLVINNKALLVQPLLNVFYSVATPDNTDVLLKDSIYAAIGLSAPVLEKELNFDTFLRSTLVPEVQAQRPGYNILRRRIAIVIGQWIVVKNMDRSLVYEIFQFLLDKNVSMNDLVVRVTAGRQMKHVIEPWDIQIEQFMPFAKIVLVRIVALVEEVDLVETKLALLNTINTIVVRMEHHVDPFADQLVSSLPLIWAQAGDDYLVKTVILGILSALITSIKQQSVRFHGLILPLIRSSVDPTSETRLYLLDDALDLWTSLLAQATEPTEAILHLRQLLFPMFDTASEAMRKAFELTEAYIILAPAAMIDDSQQFISVFATLLGSNLKTEAVGVIMRLVELLLQYAYKTGGVERIIKVAEIVAQELLPQFLVGLKSAYDANETTGPNKIHSDIDNVVETEYLCILARVLVASPQLFVQMISVKTAGFERTMQWLLAEWLSHFEAISSPDARKLNCLALTSLLELGPQPWLLDRLQQFMGIWTDVITECVESNEDGLVGERDSLVYDLTDSYKFSGPEAPEDIRRRELLYTDPVHRINIKDFVREHFRKIVADCGGQQAFQREWLANVDTDVMNSFGSIGIV